MRIICISDGEDNKSNITMDSLRGRLLRDHVTLDAFCLPKEDNLNLRTLAYSTYGYNFQPSTGEEAMAICELEPVLSIHERPPPPASGANSIYRGTSGCSFTWLKGQVKVDVVNRDTLPKRKEHPQLSGSFVELGHFRRPPTLRTGNNLRLNRIHAEMRDCGARVHPHYDIYVCEQNFGLWKVVMQGKWHTCFFNVPHFYLTLSFQPFSSPETHSMPPWSHISIGHPPHRSKPSL